MKKTALVWVVVLAGLTAASAQATILTPTDSIIVSDSTTRTSLGTVDPGGAASYAARGRGDTSQNSQQVVSFFQFDVSSLSVADVNNPGFSADFRIDYTFRINTLNDFSVEVGRNQGDAWDSTSGSLYPLHDWGFDDETSTVAAADRKVLIASVLGTDPTVTDVTADVSDIVKGWVEGTNDNWGFVLYYDANSFQAAGFENPELVITIPEPSTIGLLILTVLGLTLSRRRCSK
jgi:hypothetical protein